MIHVLVVSECAVYREGLRTLLASCEGITVAGVAGDADEAAAFASRANQAPDLFLLDMSSRDAVPGARRLLASLGSVRIVALNATATDDAVAEYANLDVVGLAMPETPLDELVRSIELAAHGVTVCPPAVASALLRRVKAVSGSDNAVDRVLTVRERQIIALVREGLSNKEIAQRLTVAVPTVRNHIHNILAKLGAHSRGEAASLVGRNSL